MNDVPPPEAVGIALTDLEKYQVTKDLRGRRSGVDSFFFLVSGNQFHLSLNRHGRMLPRRLKVRRPSELGLGFSPRLLVRDMSLLISCRTSPRLSVGMHRESQAQGKSVILG
jgi:hypothetical protein